MANKIDKAKKKVNSQNFKKYKKNANWKNFVIYGLVFVFLAFILMGFNQPTLTDTTTIPLSQAVKDSKDGKVKEIVVYDNKLVLTEGTKKLQAYKEPGSDIYTLFKDAGVDLGKITVTVNDKTTMNNWMNIVISILPIVLMVAFFYFIFRQARGAQDSVFSFGQSKAKLYSKDTPKIGFNDVAGVDEAKAELTEIVDFLKNPAKYRSVGARTPKGVLMIGPAGTGKTLLARATAGEAGVPFFSMAGSEFMEMLVGVGASRVRDLFNTAKKNQPAIIFIDEIDAIGRQRGGGFMGGHDEREQTLNQILVEMDGFTPNEQLIVMAATNRPDVLDPALIRPGRFDRRVALELPDVAGRKNILAIHSKGKPIDTNVDWDRVAKRTVGFSGADLENMLNEAAIRAARNGKKKVDMSDIEEASTKVKLGPEKKRLQSETDRKMTAYHEAGHALVGWEMPHIDPIHRISIVSRGMSLGHTMTEPIDRVHETKSHLLEEIAMMLGGQAAEKIVFDDITTGASNDLEKATQVARAMVMRFGMSSLGPITLEVQKETPYDTDQLSPDMQSRVDTEVKRIIDEGYVQATSVLKKLRKKLDILAEELLKVETLESEEFEKLIGPKKILPGHKPAILPLQGVS
jgi:cell division protease FtsH